MFMGKILHISVLLLFLVHTECYNILAVFNIPSKSLHLAATTMMQILSEKGHNVTMVTAFKLDQKHANLTHVFLKDTAEFNERTYTNFFDFDMNPYQTLLAMEEIGVENCKHTFEDRALQKLLKSGQTFDLLIIETYVSNSLLYLSEYYNIPVLLYESFDAGYAINPLFGNPAPPSYIPNVLLLYSSDMSFFQRLDNSFMYILNELIFNFYTLPNHDKIIKKHFPNAPDISQYSLKSSVVLMNTDVSVIDPVPQSPGMVHIGGYHINEPKPLPEDLEKIMSNAKHGVIFFSLGSNIKSSKMPKSRVREILEIFSRLKETIIWKWEDDDLPGKPSNVIVRKWLPQNDILAHKNVKLFITHGGFHSILETVYHGVPCVSLSVFMDQGTNSYRVANLGFAEWLQYKHFTPEKFENAIRKTLTDPRYKKVAKERSKIMRDKPMAPRETIAFWVDYVVRHGGAEHLRLAALKLSWYQYLLLDVVLFTIVSLILIVYLSMFFVKTLVSILFKKQSKKKRE